MVSYPVLKNFWYNNFLNKKVEKKLSVKPTPSSDEFKLKMSGIKIDRVNSIRVAKPLIFFSV